MEKIRLKNAKRKQSCIAIVSVIFFIIHFIFLILIYSDVLLFFIYVIFEKLEMYLVNLSTDIYFAKRILICPTQGTQTGLIQDICQTDEI